MTKQSIEIDLAYNRGKVEAYSILYGHTQDSRHKVFLDNAKEKITRLEEDMKELESKYRDGKAIDGSIQFQIEFNETGDDFSVLSEVFISKKDSDAYGVIPAAMAQADSLIRITEGAMNMFTQQQTPEGDATAKNLFLLHELLMRWMGNWGKSLLELYKPQSKIIT